MERRWIEVPEIVKWYQNLKKAAEKEV